MGVILQLPGFMVFVTSLHHSTASNDMELASAARQTGLYRAKFHTAYTFSALAGLKLTKQAQVSHLSAGWFSSPALTSPIALARTHQPVKPSPVDSALDRKPFQNLLIKVLLVVLGLSDHESFACH